MELNVPGVKLQFVKRLYDAKLDFTVQDLCVVDCIQTFGPEFELVVCSGGKSLLKSSPLKKSELSPIPVTVGMEKSYSCPVFNNSASNLSVSRSNATTPGLTPMGTCLSQRSTPIGVHQPQLPPSPREVMFSPENDSLGLLSVSYKHLSPFSPEHPAMKDFEFKNGEGGEGERGEGEGGEEKPVLPGEGEPGIRKVSVHCTAVDVMGKIYVPTELPLVGDCYFEYSAPHSRQLSSFA